jgi:cob(I)alamin adenosyltransferase
VKARGLVIVFTGDGKGKTSAAMGIALRASGHRMYVSVIQFIKGPRASGEQKAIERLAPNIELLSMGKGYVGLLNDPMPRPEHAGAAREALVRARQQMHSGSWDVVILDEINTALFLGLLDIDEVLELVKTKPPRVHLVLTGRGAPPSLIEIADLATEMRSLKHPYDGGTPAQQGIDY